MENTTTKKVSALSLMITIGVIFGLLDVLALLIQYYTGWLEQEKGRWLVWALYPVKIIIAILLVKKFRNSRLGGYITFGRAFNITFLSVLFSGLIGSPFYFIFYRVWHPEVMSKMMKTTVTKMVAMGLTDDQIDAAMKYSKMMSDSAAITIASHVLFYIISGLVLGIIVAPFCKKESGEFMPA